MEYVGVVVRTRVDPKSDFGLSKMLYNDTAMLQTACGTPGYVGKYSLPVYFRHEKIKSSTRNIATTTIW